MEKLIVIKNLGKSDKKPIFGNNVHYEIQKVKLGEKEFFRRQKIKNEKVTSSSYAYDINSKQWIASLYQFLDKNP